MQKYDIKINLHKHDVHVNVYDKETKELIAYAHLFLASDLYGIEDLKGISKDCFYLRQIFVIENFRKKGISGALLEYCEKWLKDNKNCDSIILIPDYNESIPHDVLISFYEKRGYKRYDGNGLYWFKKLK
jgi:GNAT superfamily N-acetyltransferase